MLKPTCFFLVMGMVMLANCQLFNDILPPVKGGSKFGGQKTINFDSIKLSDRPGAKNGYLPPQPPTYLPPVGPISPSTGGPTYLPPTTTRITTKRPISYMPTMGTFPPTRNYTYPTITYPTYKPYKTPKPLPPIVTSRRPTTGYAYDKPNVQFTVEDLKRGGRK